MDNERDTLLSSLELQISICLHICRCISIYVCMYERRYEYDEDR